MNGPGVLSGVRTFPRALRLLRQRRELWLLCTLPLATSLVAFGLAVVVFLANLDAAAALVGGWLAVADPEQSYAWIWVGPLRALAWLTRWVLLLAFAAAVYVLFTVVGGVLASPFLDELSARVERIASGEGIPPGPSGLRGLLSSSGRAVVQEAKRTAFFVSVQAGLLALGLVPGLQPLVVLAIPLFSALFLPLEYTGYVLDRRGVRFRERRGWIWRHRRAMLPFGAGALASFLIPGLNFLCLPWLVCAGTLLALEVGPPQPRAG